MEGAAVYSFDDDAADDRLLSWMEAVSYTNLRLPLHCRTSHRFTQPVSLVIPCSRSERHVQVGKAEHEMCKIASEDLAQLDMA